MKRCLVVMLLCCCMRLFSACTMPYWAYIRNISGKDAIVAVVLLRRSNMNTLPNRVKVANEIVQFKPGSGYRQFFSDYENVQWIDTVHFTFTVRPGTTADLTDMAGKFSNAHPEEDMFVTVTTGNKKDTLINGRDDFRYTKFAYKRSFFNDPVLYYDVK